MITLSLLKFIEDNGLGKIDKDLFFQKLTLRKVGIYITDLSTPLGRGTRKRQDFELYSRGVNDVDGYRRLSDVINLLNNSYGICRLPSVPPVFTEPYRNVTIMPMSGISNLGVDNNGHVIYSASGAIYY